MSVVRQCDSCRAVGPRRDPKWIILRVVQGTRAGVLGGETIDYDDTDYCSWRCAAEAASIRAHETEMRI